MAQNHSQKPDLKICTITNFNIIYTYACIQSIVYLEQVIYVSPLKRNFSSRDSKEKSLEAFPDSQTWAASLDMGQSSSSSAVSIQVQWTTLCPTPSSKASHVGSGAHTAASYTYISYHLKGETFRSALQGLPVSPILIYSSCPIPSSGLHTDCGNKGCHVEWL